LAVTHMYFRGEEKGEHGIFSWHIVFNITLNEFSRKKKKKKKTRAIPPRFSTMEIISIRFDFRFLQRGIFNYNSLLSYLYLHQVSLFMKNLMINSKKKRSHFYPQCYACVYSIDGRTLRLSISYFSFGQWSLGTLDR